MTSGYGRAESADGNVVRWAFPILGTYWDAGDIQIEYLARSLGGWDKLKGKKIADVYHNSPYGKEAIPVLQVLAKQHDFELQLLPVTHPGVEQKATWLQIRQNRPDFTLLWGWGVMNSTALKEAAAVTYPRDKMLGVWWAGAEADTVPAEDAAKGYKALALNPPGSSFPVHQQIFAQLYEKNLGAADRKDVGSRALQPRHDQCAVRDRGGPHRARRSSATSRWPANRSAGVSKTSISPPKRSTSLGSRTCWGRLR